MGVDREYIVWRWRCVDIKRSVDFYCVDNELGLDIVRKCVDITDMCVDM